MLQELAMGSNYYHSDQQCGVLRSMVALTDDRFKLGRFCQYQYHSRCYMCLVYYAVRKKQ